MSYRVRICTFIDAEGEGYVRGKLWKWEFSEHLGPTFLTPKTGEVMTNQPSEKHPVWRVFEDWLAEYRKTHPRDESL